MFRNRRCSPAGDDSGLQHRIVHRKPEQHTSGRFLRLRRHESLRRLALHPWRGSAVRLRSILGFGPLRSDKESTSYCFQYLQKDLNFPQLYDTITVRYTSEPYFTSEECGLSFIYTVTDLSFTTHLIDSVKLLDNKITPADVEQLQIYFRTATDSPETPGDNGDNQNPTARTRGINPDGHENR